LPQGDRGAAPRRHRAGAAGPPALDRPRPGTVAVMSDSSRRVAVRPTDPRGTDGPETPAHALAHARVRFFTRRGPRLDDRQQALSSQRAGIVLHLPSATSTTIPDDTTIDLAAEYGRTDGRLVVEIGCGAGEQLAHAAAAAPLDRFLGEEVWLPGL